MNFSFHYGKTYKHMLWKSVKCDCCVFECRDNPYPGIISTPKKYFWVASIQNTTYCNKKYILYGISYIL